MSEPVPEDYISVKRMDSVNEYARIIVKDLNDMMKTYKITYKTDTEIYKKNYIVKIIVDKSESTVIKAGDAAIAITPNTTEENTRLLGILWKRKRQRIHLSITLYMDKIPGIRAEAIRALFKLYSDKLLANLRMHELKDADSKIDFIFT